RCAVTRCPLRAAPQRLLIGDDNLDAHAYDTISGGDWLCNQDAVEAFVRTNESLRLEHWGCPWSRTTDSHAAVRTFGSMTHPLAAYPARLREVTDAAGPPQHYPARGSLPTRAGKQTDYSILSDPAEAGVDSARRPQLHQESGG